MSELVLPVLLSKQTTVICRKGLLAELARHREQLLKRGALVFTDSNVYKLYKEELNAQLPAIPVHVMQAGETYKTEQTLFDLLHAMGEAGLRRTSVLIAFGGGVVGDVGGLAASLYMRGIDVVQIPTTLLALADSAVGGKTAIDFMGIKNLIGAFHFPRYVLADPTYLATLLPREMRSGLGEIIKTAALNASLFERLAAQNDLFSLDFLAEIIPQVIGIKAEFVTRDPADTGLRAALNLGHTTAHAIELSRADLSHGECVLMGMLLEAEIAKKYCAVDRAYLGELSTLCRRVLSEPIAQIDFDTAEETARYDKKNAAKGEISLIVPTQRGRYETLKLSPSEYREALKEARDRLC